MAHRFDEVDRLAIDTIRTLAMDAVQKANSGHPGTPVALAPVAWLLYSRFLRHDPADPSWPGRDRFVLSCGHASMLLYAVLHLTGYDLSLDDLKAFRQWGSRTPGHPEFGETPGVEITTGPLGSGCAASVGMAMAEAHLAARFDREGEEIVAHRTWALVSDGDLMEGVAHEAASLAGHLGLERLVWIWDDNRITIEGSTDLAFTEDVPARFRALGWRTLEVADVNDLDALADVLEAASAPDGRPTLVRVRSHIAWGVPGKQDTAAAHGAPLGEEAIRAAKRALGWPEDATFRVPEAVLERGRKVASRGAARHGAWRQALAEYREAHPELAAEWERRMAGRLPEGWDTALPRWEPGETLATRAASGKALTALGGRVPEIVGGSADLGPSCKTTLPGEADLERGTPEGRVVHFGIRENAMGMIMNGMALHGGVRPFGSTFLVFSDYARPAIRLAALMRLPVVWVFTHDSIAVGEDGPTHQPVEHVAALRAIPELTVIRPADANETAAAWAWALESAEGPVALILSRQGLPVLPGTAGRAREAVERGAAVLRDVDRPDLVLLATGSEVALAMEAAEALAGDGIAARVVSMPSWERFEAAGAAHRETVLPPGVPVLAVEAGVTQGWGRYADDAVGIDRFGASAPGPVVYERMGFTAAAVAARARRLLGRD